MSFMCEFKPESGPLSSPSRYSFGSGRVALENIMPTTPWQMLDMQEGTCTPSVGVASRDLETAEGGLFRGAGLLAFIASGPLASGQPPTADAK